MKCSHFVMSCMNQNKTEPHKLSRVRSTDWKSSLSTQVECCPFVVIAIYEPMKALKCLFVFATCGFLQLLGSIYIWTEG